MIASVTSLVSIELLPVIRKLQKLAKLGNTMSHKTVDLNPKSRALSYNFVYTIYLLVSRGVGNILAFFLFKYITTQVAEPLIPLGIFFFIIIIGGIFVYAAFFALYEKTMGEVMQFLDGSRTQTILKDTRSPSWASFFIVCKLFLFLGLDIPLFATALALTEVISQNLNTRLWGISTFIVFLVFLVELISILFSVKSRINLHYQTSSSIIIYDTFNRNETFDGRNALLVLSPSGKVFVCDEETNRHRLYYPEDIKCIKIENIRIRFKVEEIQRRKTTHKEITPIIAYIGHNRLQCLVEKIRTCQP